MSLFTLPAIIAIIGDTVELGSTFYWLRVEFAIPDIVNPKNGATVAGGQIISNDLLINLAGTTLLNQQTIADAFAESYANAIINRQIMSIINT